MKTKPIKSNKRGFTAGAFDLCHAGHIKMFRDAKNKCDYLVVGLQIDPSITPKEYRGKQKAPPIMSLEERLTILEGIKYIDEIRVYRTEEDLYELIQKVKPHVRFLGDDWRGKDFTGRDLNIEIKYTRRDHGYSSTELKRRIIIQFFKNATKKLAGIQRPTRQSF